MVAAAGAVAVGDVEERRGEERVVVTSSLFENEGEDLEGIEIPGGGGGSGAANGGFTEGVPCWSCKVRPSISDDGASVEEYNDDDGGVSDTLFLVNGSCSAANPGGGGGSEGCVGLVEVLIDNGWLGLVGTAAAVSFCLGLSLNVLD